jgi:hypothetical protein
MLRQQLEDAESVNAQLAKQKRLLEIESTWAEDPAPAVHRIELESFQNLNMRLQTEKPALQVQLQEERAKCAASQEQIDELASQNQDLPAESETEVIRQPSERSGTSDRRR